MSRMSDAAFEWLKKNTKKTVSTEELWTGMTQVFPELTAVSERRKTPRTTLMRDLRKDKAQRFIVGGRQVTLK